MKIASFSTFSNDLRRAGIKAAVEHMNALGFDAVETFDFHPSAYEMPVYRAFSAKEIRKSLDAHGLVAACHSVAVRRLDQADAASLEDLYRQIEFAAQIGAPYFHHTLVLPLKPLPEAPDYRAMLDAVLPAAEGIADRCEEYGITCLYEPQGMYFNGVDGLRPLLEGMRLRGKKKLIFNFANG